MEEKISLKRLFGVKFKIEGKADKLDKLKKKAERNEKKIQNTNYRIK